MIEIDYYGAENGRAGPSSVTLPARPSPKRSKGGPELHASFMCKAEIMERSYVHLVQGLVAPMTVSKGRVHREGYGPP